SESSAWRKQIKNKTTSKSGTRGKRRSDLPWITTWIVGGGTDRSSSEVGTSRMPQGRMSPPFLTVWRTRGGNWKKAADGFETLIIAGLFGVGRLYGGISGVALALTIGFSLYATLIRKEKFRDIFRILAPPQGQRRLNPLTLSFLVFPVLVSSLLPLKFTDA